MKHLLNHVLQGRDLSQQEAEARRRVERRAAEHDV